MATATWSRPVPAEAPPATFTLELTQYEASALASLLGKQTGGSGTSGAFDALADALDESGVGYAKRR